MINCALGLLFAQRLVCVFALLWALRTDTLWILPGLLSLTLGFAAKMTMPRRSAGLPAVKTNQKLSPFALHVLDTVSVFLLAPLLFADAWLFSVVFALMLLGHVILPPSRFTNH